MNRSYNIEHYLGRIEMIKKLLPDCTITTDIIAGFCTETDKDHELTLELMKLVQYDGAYMFKYSPRENTKAWSYKDDVPEHIKLLRLNEIINLQNEISKEKNKKEINKVHEVLAEGQSKRNPQKWQGRTDTNKVVIFDNSIAKISVGELIKIKINDSTSATLFGVPVN
jgi:tRNA-2-methylthio-N6-dimethylallyladenosine synthase